MWGQGEEKKEPPRTVTVRGMGKVKVVPDHLRLTIQVNVPRSATAVEALTRNNQLAAAVLEMLKRFGVADADIQTTRVSVSPVYDYDRRISPPPIVGYSALNEILVILKKMDDAGKILDQAIKVGATGFGPLQYESSKRDGLEREALKKAADDAKTKAQLLARQLGAGLGDVLKISEMGAAAPPPRYERMAIAAEAASVPIMPGEMEIQATVEVVFELK